ncbi:hypothetical protein CPLU01_05745 [Neofusicoccum parvum]|nr:hypothetical protein CPLU01_05745 [Neofusicoccum parvum]
MHFLDLSASRTRVAIGRLLVLAFFLIGFVTAIPVPIPQDVSALAAKGRPGISKAKPQPPANNGKPTGSKESPSNTGSNPFDINITPEELFNFTSIFSPRQASSSIVINSPADAAKHITPPPKNKAMFWSGVPFDLGQNSAKQLGLKTLELSVGDNIINHPQALPTNPQWDLFWGNFSAAFGEVAASSGSDFVTVAIRAPKEFLTKAGDPFTDGRMVQSSDWARNELPVLKSAGVRIMAVHPIEASKAAATDAYEVWPNDKAFEWQKRNGGGKATKTTVQCGVRDNAITATCINGDIQESGTARLGTAESKVQLQFGGACRFTAAAPKAAGQPVQIEYTTTTSSLNMTFACGNI